MFSEQIVAELDAVAGRRIMVGDPGGSWRVGYDTYENYDSPSARSGCRPGR